MKFHHVAVGRVVSRVLFGLCASAIALLVALSVQLPARGQSVPLNWEYGAVPGANVAEAGSASVAYGSQTQVLFQADGKLRQSFRAGSGTWATAVLDGEGGSRGRVAGTVGAGVSAVLFGNQLQAFYIDSTNGRLRQGFYSPTSGEWTFVDLDGPGVAGGNGRTASEMGGRTATVLFRGGPHVFYADVTAAAVRHAWWGGSAWFFETLDGTVGPRGQTTGAVEPYFAATVAGDTLAVFYRDDVAARLRSAVVSGPAWSYADLDGPGVTGGNGRQDASTGLEPSAVGFAGQPHVFYRSDAVELRHGWRSPSGAWNFETLMTSTSCPAGSAPTPVSILDLSCAPGGSSASIVHNGGPHVFHSDTLRGRLLQSWWDGSAWRQRVLDGSGASGSPGQTADAVGGAISVASVGAELRVQFTGATTATMRTARWGRVAPGVLDPPSIAGNALVGATLSASAGVWNGAPSAQSHKWQRCSDPVDPSSCSDIAGATAPKFVVGDDDIGNVLRVVVTATNAGGATTAASATTAQVPMPSPVVTSLDPSSGPDRGGTEVAVTGRYFVDVTGVTVGGTAASYSVDSATRITMTTPAGTAGAADVVVTSTAGAGAASVFTYDLTPPTNTVAPTISGDAVVDAPLSVTGGTWTRSPSGYTLQWQRCEPAETNCVDIVDATASTYAVTAADAGKVLRAVETATNSAGSTAAASAPTAVVPTLLQDVKQIAAGYRHTCALLADATMRCWGDNQYSQLGVGSWYPSGTLPVVVATSYLRTAALSDVVQITAGGGHTCALLVDTTVRCWGANSNGQVGNGATANTPTPAVVANPANPAVALSGVVEVRAGAAHTCARLADATARCWGANGYGELGNNSTAGSTLPVVVADPTNTSAALSGVAQVMPGMFHTCARLVDATVRCWGLGSVGQLGNNSRANSKVPVVVADPSNPSVALSGVAELATGAFHNCVRIADATARCWGDNSPGALGNNSTTTSSLAVTVRDPSNPSAALSGIAELAAGVYHTCARLLDATARCWGYNDQGQLGSSSASNQSSLPVEVSARSNPSAAMPGVVALTGGQYHSCARLADDTARCWGSNDYGQLGNNSKIDSRVPFAVFAGLPLSQPRLLAP